MQNTFKLTLRVVPNLSSHLQGDAYKDVGGGLSTQILRYIAQVIPSRVQTKDELTVEDQFCLVLSLNQIQRESLSFTR